MEKVFKLSGLNCPHCSAEIEKDIGKLKGISSSNINLMRQTLTVNVENGYSGSLFKDIEKIVHTHEPDVEVTELHTTKIAIKPHCETVVFTLKGLDCPHCSAEIEEEAGKLEGISSSSVNLVTQTLTLELDGEYSGNLLNDIEKIVHTHEPEVEVIPGNESNEQICSPAKEKKEVKTDRAIITRLIVGGVIYAVGFLLAELAEVSLYVQLPIFIVAYIILGYDVVLKAVKNILRGRVFDENFLMTISTVGAFAIGEYPEAVAVMLFYQIGEFFQNLAVQRSRKSISDLMDIRPDYANVMRGGREQRVSPEDVKVGEIIVVKPGEKIPLDGIVADGKSMLDTRALTGESVPREVTKGDAALSGCINGGGMLSVEVTKPFGESTASKIIDLVENAAGRKAPTENFITTFSKYYTPIVVILAALLAVLPPLLFGYSWADWIHRGFVFLVISCPCALVISIPLTFFGGIGAASKKGVLVKGGNYLEALNSIETIVFDKTGTLTKGVFNVTEVFAADGFTKDDVLNYAAAAECMSNHPIARSIEAAAKRTVDRSAVKNCKEVSGQGVSAEFNGNTILAGNEKLMNSNSVKFKSGGEFGTVVHIAVDGKYAGYIIISDEIKEDSAAAIEGLKKLGVKKCVMLTGDNEKTAKAVSEKLNLDLYYANLLPNEKVDKVEELFKTKSQNGKLAFVGDGINDAPVLARADIGIAMGALGSDAAIEAADVVLMTDEPSKLIEAIDIAKYTKKIVAQNIVIVLVIKVLFLILGAMGVAGMWEAVFGDVGVMIIAVINSMRLLQPFQKAEQKL